MQGSVSSAGPWIVGLGQWPFWTPGRSFFNALRARLVMMMMIIMMYNTITITIIIMIMIIIIIIVIIIEVRIPDV